MNLANLALNSSNVANGFLHKMSKKGPDINAMIIKVSAIFGLRSQIQTKIGENLSIILLGIHPRLGEC